MKVKTIKKKVAAKVAKGKAKVAAKCGKCAKACAVAVLMAVLCTAFSGCQGLTSPSRSQSLTLDHCTVNIYGGGRETNDVARVEIASQAMIIENSGSETHTATPTQTTDVKPDIDVAVPVTKGSAGAASDALGSLVGGCTDGSCSGK